MRSEIPFMEMELSELIFYVLFCFKKRILVKMYIMIHTNIDKIFLKKY